METLELITSRFGGVTRMFFFLRFQVASVSNRCFYSVPFGTADGLGTPLMKVAKGSTFGYVYSSIHLF